MVKFNETKDFEWWRCPTCTTVSVAYKEERKVDSTFVESVNTLSQM